MPDLRRDPIVGRWVIISTERSSRPHDFIPLQAARPLAAALCPFCPGQERLTPKEIMAYRLPPVEPNGPNWTVRVVPNKFPALQPRKPGRRTLCVRFRRATPNRDKHGSLPPSCHPSR